MVSENIWSEDKVTGEWRGWRRAINIKTNEGKRRRPKRYRGIDTMKQEKEK
jgi:hypothetical protein